MSMSITPMSMSITPLLRRDGGIHKGLHPVGITLDIRDRQPSRETGNTGANAVQRRGRAAR